MNTKEPFVITISREVGSGGHTVGSILAEKLGVHYYDLVLRADEHSEEEIADLILSFCK